MIILLHGTGDDSSKFENWMRWVDAIMRKHGETVLTVPGVGSKGKVVLSGGGEGSEFPDDDEIDVGQGSIGPGALEFLSSLGDSAAAPPRPKSKVDQLTGYSSAGRNRRDYPKLLDALNGAGGDEFPRAARVAAGQEEDLIRQLAENKRKDGPAVGTGIKYRAAITSICAIAYDRRARGRNPIRMIGHSRGGSTAVAVHNILTYYGLDCSTLTLDPCHGKAKLVEKDYYRKIWGGKLVNLPNEKNVKFDHLPDVFMCRPAIGVGKGGRAEIVALPRTKHIKHGHMGKIRGFSEADKSNGSQAHLGMQIQSWLDEQTGTNPQATLMQFFQRFVVEPNSPLGMDRRIIAKQVVEVLTGPLPDTATAFWHV
jgi:hypothetical protein